MEPGPAPDELRTPDRRPWLLVAAAVVFGLVVLYPETRDVWSLNDASIHASMVRWAAGRIRAGALPFDGWYPYLSFGASRFHHYQSLPHILTGAVSVVFGPATFRWSLYLGLATWPIAVYAGARLFELDRWTAAAAAVAAPLVASVPGMGYEWGTYVWRGAGAWAQLWGMWALPFAWALSWRAVSGRGRRWPAALVVAFTVCVHLLTGYLALLSLAVWVLVGAPREWWRRFGRACAVGAAALLASAWMLVPLVADADWTTQDEFSRGTFYYDSFGAPKVLGWMVRGELFDRGRLPALSLLVGVGLVVAIVRSRREEPPRAILGVGLVSLLLFFGRPTLGAVIDLLPGGGDLFLRRYVFGVHLAGIWLAGIGATAATAWLAGTWRRWVPARAAWGGVAAAAIVGLAFVPAAVERVGYERVGAGWIDEQIQADATDGAAFAALVRRAADEGPGRIYAGSRSSVSPSEKIGQVPAFAALLDLDADQVGFTRPTWSVMSGVEHRVRVSRAADPRLFGIRYLIVPEGSFVPEGFEPVASAGRFELWMDPGTSYLGVVDTVAPFAADRTNLGARIDSVLDSSLPGRGLLPTVAFAGRPGAAPTVGPNDEPTGSPGSVSLVAADPAAGRVAGTVEADGPAVALLRASFDPRWEATVDGVSVPVQMVAPGFVGVAVPGGTSDVAFVYRPFGWYGPLFALAAATIVALVVWDRRRGLRNVETFASADRDAEHPAGHRGGARAASDLEGGSDASQEAEMERPPGRDRGDPHRGARRGRHVAGRDPGAGRREDQGLRQQADEAGPDHPDEQSL